MVLRVPSKVLAVVPTYVAAPADVGLVIKTLDTLAETAPGVECLVVDDCSPAGELLEEIDIACSRLSFRLHRKDVNEGFSRAVNVGLREARDRGMHALLCNSDIEFTHDDWLDHLLLTDAWIVGPRLLYPSGLIQSAGTYFSLLSRVFDHRFRFAPGNLPEALKPATCPVTAALHLIDHECLTEVGLYDEEFRMGWEDVDYAIRCFQGGGVCRYVPTSVAVHHESVFRGQRSERVERWEHESWAYFKRKYAEVSFTKYVPSLV